MTPEICARRLLIILVCFLAWITITPAVAQQTVLVDDQSAVVRLDGHLQYWFDHDHQLTLDALLRDTQPQWKRVDGTSPGFLYQAVPLWVRLDLRGGGSTGNTFLLELASPYLDRIDFFHVRYDAYGQPYIYDEAVDTEQDSARRLFKARFPVFAVPLEPGELATLYVRIDSTSALMAPMTLWRLEDYVGAEQRSLILYGMFFGIMLVMALYNASLYLFLRDKTYLYYVGFVLVVIGYEASLTGFGARYLWSELDWLKQHGMTLFICLGFWLGGKFVIEFLDLRRRNPRFHAIATLLVRAFAGCAVLALVLPESIVVPITQPLGLLACVMVLWAGIYQWRQGSQWARYLVIAWSVLMVGTSLFILMMIGWLPRNPFTEYVQIVGFVLETTLLSVALAARVNEERLAKSLALETALDLAHQVNLANQKNLLLQQQVNQELESRVSKQTWQLQSTLDKLFEANDRLERLTVTDPLTGLRNRRFFDEQFPRDFEQCRLVHQPMTLIVMDIDHFKLINDRHGHAVGDQCLEMVARVIASSCQRPDDRIVRFGGEEFVILLPRTDIAGANRVAERIRSLIEKTDFVLQGKRVPVTISVGVASQVPALAGGHQALFSEADRALYEAKSAGRNCVRVAV